MDGSNLRSSFGQGATVNIDDLPGNPVAWGLPYRYPAPRPITVGSSAQLAGGEITG